MCYRLVLEVCWHYREVNICFILCSLLCFWGGGCRCVYFVCIHSFAWLAFWVSSFWWQGFFLFPVRIYLLTVISYHVESYNLRDDFSHIPTFWVMGCLYIKLHLNASASPADGGGGDSYNEHNVCFNSLVRHSYGLPGCQREKRVKSRGSGKKMPVKSRGSGKACRVKSTPLPRRAWHVMVQWCAICIHMWDKQHALK